MKRIYTPILILLFTLISNFSFAQNRITVPLEAFNSLSVSGRIDLELIPSDSKEMSITSLNGQPEEVKIELKDGELKVHIRPKFDKEDVYTIKLPYKSLSRIESLAGAVVNSARDLEVTDLELKAASGGKIELSVSVKNINARITQISDIILYGSADSQNVNVTTGGNYLAYDLICKDTYIKASAGSQAKVTASRIIEATANSKGYIGYIGDPVSAFTKTSLGGEIASFKSKADTEVF